MAVNQLKAVIIGAGIGGLTAGIALRQAGYAVEIYERVKEIRPVGAGISLWSNGVKVLNRLGLGAEMARIGGQMDRMQYRYKTDALLNDIDLFPLIQEVGQRPYPVARADLQQMLLQAFTGPLHLGVRCTGVEETASGVTAFLDDGRQATGDLLIAADGIRSSLRQYVLGRDVQPSYGGYVNWNGLVTASPELAPPNTWMIYVGDFQRASLMPVGPLDGQERYYFFFDVPLPSGTGAHPEEYRAELNQFFMGWPEPVQKLIQQLDPDKTNRLDIHDLGPIERMVRGRVALLGDAAHATCPDLGQGGCQALEDVEVLTRYLQTTTLGVPYALMRYEQERKERAAAIVKKARSRAEQIHGKDPEVTRRWYEQLRQERPADVTGAIAKTILGGPLR